MISEGEGLQCHIDSSRIIKLKLNSRPSLTTRYRQFFAICFIEEYDDFERSVKFPLKAAKPVLAIERAESDYAAKIGPCIIVTVTQWGEIKVELISHAEYKKKIARVINIFKGSYVPVTVKSTLHVY